MKRLSYRFLESVGPSCGLEMNLNNDLRHVKFTEGIVKQKNRPNRVW